MTAHHESNTSLLPNSCKRRRPQRKYAPPPKKVVGGHGPNWHFVPQKVKSCPPPIFCTTTGCTPTPSNTQGTNNPRNRELRMTAPCPPHFETPFLDAHMNDEEREGGSQILISSRAGEQGVKAGEGWGSMVAKSRVAERAGCLFSGGL